MTFEQLSRQFAEHGMTLHITKKSVKNINFRLKVGVCLVSVPRLANMQAVLTAVHQRLPWAIANHAKLCAKVHRQTAQTLWGEPLPTKLSNDELLALYRMALQDKIPQLMTTWQPIVGRTAQEVRLKKMTTRWGTCNTHAKRVWLSLYLAAYPYECTEYVFVHELCHLIHANHSQSFWQAVKKAMPNYKHWHDLLKGKTC